MIFVKVTAEHPTHAADRTSNLSGNFRFSGIQNERPYYKVCCKGSANKSLNRHNSVGSGASSWPYLRKIHIFEIQRTLKSSHGTDVVLWSKFGYWYMSYQSNHRQFFKNRIPGGQIKKRSLGKLISENCVI